MIWECRSARCSSTEALFLTFLEGENDRRDKLFWGGLLLESKERNPGKGKTPAWGATGTTQQRCTLGGLSLVWVGDDVQVGNATEGNRFG